MLSQGHVLNLPPRKRKDSVQARLVPGLRRGDCALHLAEVKGFTLEEVRFLRCALELVPEARLVLQPWSLRCKYARRFRCGRTSTGPCLSHWLSLTLSSVGRQVRTRCMHIPKGCKLTSPLFPQYPEALEKRRQLYYSTEEWGPFSHEACVEPLSLRCGADPALHLR